MSALKWTPPPRRFFVKMLLLFVVGIGACQWGLAHYRIGFDPQATRCLPWQLYFVNLDQRDPQLGQIHTFVTAGLGPLFPDGTRFTKQVAGLPGEWVTVGRERIVVGARSYYAPILPRVLAKTGRTWDSVLRHYQLGPDEYLMLGTINAPYDSRYTGPVRLGQFRGKATPLW